MIRRALGCVVVFGGLTAGASLQAHHSTAGVYDPAKEVTVKGALAKLQFVNPHGSIVVTVKNADNTTTDWTFTTGSATALASQGMTKVGPKALKIGEEVTVDPALEQRVRAWFQGRGYAMPESNLKQAWLIPSARAIPATAARS